MLNSLVCSNYLTYFSNTVLKKVIMFTSFHSKRITPSFTDKLNTLASGLLNYSSVSISLSDIPYTPGYVLSFIVLATV